MWGINFNLEFYLSLCIGALSYILCYLCFYKKRNFGAYKNFAFCALHIYIFAVFSLTLNCYLHFITEMFGGGSFAFKQAFDAVSWSVYEEGITLYKNCKLSGSMSEFYRIIGGNLILLLPLGILIPLIDKKMNFIKMILIAIACPFIIEFLQFLGNCLVGSVLRDVSMSDFVLNAIGLLIGYGFYVLFFSGAKSGRKKSGKGK